MNLLIRRIRVLAVFVHYYSLGQISGVLDLVLVKKKPMHGVVDSPRITS